MRWQQAEGDRCRTLVQATERPSLVDAESKTEPEHTSLLRREPSRELSITPPGGQRTPSTPKYSGQFEDSSICRVPQKLFDCFLRSFLSVRVLFLAFYTNLKRSLTAKLVFQLHKVTSSIVVLLTFPACPVAVETCLHCLGAGGL